VSEVWLQHCLLSSHAFSVITFLTHLVLILLSRSFVGSMSWITLYQATLVDSGTGVSLRFFHTFVHSTCGHLHVTRISCFPDEALRLYIVGYRRLLYAVCVSVCPCGAIFADSISQRHRYTSAFGIRCVNGGFLLCVCNSHFLIQSTVIVPVRMPCARIR
jgi:hypothetical protein